MDDDADAKMILRLPIRELEETTGASPYHVAEHRPARSERLQPHTERISRPGSEPPSVEAGVCMALRALNGAYQKKEVDLLFKSF